MTRQTRSQALEAIGTAILKRRKMLGRLLSSDEGKRLSGGIGEVTRAKARGNGRRSRRASRDCVIRIKTSYLLEG